MTPRTYLFDIGNVLLHFDFSIFSRRISSGPAEEKALRDFLRAEQHGLESGRSSEREFLAAAARQLPFFPDKNAFREAWNSIFTPNLPMWDLAEKLHADGHRLILFSNTNALHAEHFLAQHPVFKFFPNHHFSHEAGTLKPEPAFYEKAIKKFELIPAQTIYFDDLPANIATGREFGFHSWQYDLENHAACLDWHASLEI